MNSTKSILALTLFLSLTSFAQNGKFFKEKKEKVKSMKIAYITNELELTPDEATKFWPLFNAFEDKQQEVKRLKLKAFLDKTSTSSFDKLSEKEASNLLIQIESYDDDLYTSKKKFIASLKGVLPSTKILRLKRAEENFNKTLLQQYKEKVRN